MFHIRITYRFILVFCLLWTGIQNTSAQSENQLSKSVDGHFSKKEFALAIDGYRQLLSNDLTNVDYNYRYAVCLYYTKNPKSSEKYFNYLMEQKQCPIEVFYFKGRLYHFNYEFENAIEMYSHYISLKTKKSQFFGASDEIKRCQNAQKLLKSPRAIQVVSQESKTSTDYFSAYLFDSLNFKRYTTEEFNKKVNSKNDFSPKYVFRRGMKYRFFSSFSKEGNSGKELYYQTKNSANDWETPIVLPSSINTPFDEDYPFYDETSGFLYFSSTGHNSMGGYDLFRTKFSLENLVGDEVENLNFPYSSTANDFLFIPNQPGANVFFTTDRNEDYGNVKVVEARFNAPVLSSLIASLSFKDAIDKGNTKALFYITNEQSKEKFGPYRTNSQGLLYFIVPAAGAYMIEATVSGSDKIFYDTIDIPPHVEGFEFEVAALYKTSESREVIEYDQNLIELSDMVVDIENIELTEFAKLAVNTKTIDAAKEVLIAEEKNPLSNLEIQNRIDQLFELELELEDRIRQKIKLTENVNELYAKNEEVDEKIDYVLSKNNDLSQSAADSLNRILQDLLVDRQVVVSTLLTQKGYNASMNELDELKELYFQVANLNKKANDFQSNGQVDSLSTLLKSNQIDSKNELNEFSPLLIARADVTRKEASQIDVQQKIALVSQELVALNKEKSIFSERMNGLNDLDVWNHLNDSIVEINKKLHTLETESIALRQRDEILEGQLIYAKEGLLNITLIDADGDDLKNELSELKIEVNEDKYASAELYAKDQVAAVDDLSNLSNAQKELRNRVSMSNLSKPIRDSMNIVKEYAHIIELNNIVEQQKLVSENKVGSLIQDSEKIIESLSRTNEESQELIPLEISNENTAVEIAQESTKAVTNVVSDSEAQNSIIAVEETNNEREQAAGTNSLANEITANPILAAESQNQSIAPSALVNGTKENQINEVSQNNGVLTERNSNNQEPENVVSNVTVVEEANPETEFITSNEVFLASQSAANESSENAKASPVSNEAFFDEKESVDAVSSESIATVREGTQELIPLDISNENTVIEVTQKNRIVASNPVSESRDQNSIAVTNNTSDGPKQSISNNSSANENAEISISSVESQNQSLANNEIVKVSEETQANKTRIDASQGNVIVSSVSDPKSIVDHTGVDKGNDNGEIVQNENDEIPISSVESQNKSLANNEVAKVVDETQANELPIDTSQVNAIASSSSDPKSLVDYTGVETGNENSGLAANETTESPRISVESQPQSLSNSPLANGVDENKTSQGLQDTKELAQGISLSPASEDFSMNEEVAIDANASSELAVSGEELSISTPAADNVSVALQNKESKEQPLAINPQENTVIEEAQSNTIPVKGSVSGLEEQNTVAETNTTVIAAESTIDIGQQSNSDLIKNEIASESHEIEGSETRVLPEELNENKTIALNNNAEANEGTSSSQKMDANQVEPLNEAASSKSINNEQVAKVENEDNLGVNGKTDSIVNGNEFSNMVFNSRIENVRFNEENIQGQEFGASIKLLTTLIFDAELEVTEDNPNQGRQSKKDAVRLLKIKTEKEQKLKYYQNELELEIANQNIETKYLLLKKLLPGVQFESIENLRAQLLEIEIKEQDLEKRLKNAVSQNEINMLNKLIQANQSRKLMIQEELEEMRYFNPSDLVVEKKAVDQQEIRVLLESAQYLTYVENRQKLQDANQLLNDLSALNRKKMMEFDASLRATLNSDQLTASQKFQVKEIRKLQQAIVYLEEEVKLRKLELARDNEAPRYEYLYQNNENPSISVVDRKELSSIKELQDLIPIIIEKDALNSVIPYKEETVALRNSIKVMESEGYQSYVQDRVLANSLAQGLKEILNSSKEFRSQDALLNETDNSANNIDGMNSGSNGSQDFTNHSVDMDINSNIAENSKNNSGGINASLNAADKSSNKIDGMNSGSNASQDVTNHSVDMDINSNIAENSKNNSGGINASLNAADKSSNKIDGMNSGSNASQDFINNSFDANTSSNGMLNPSGTELSVVSLLEKKRGAQKEDIIETTNFVNEEKVRFIKGKLETVMNRLGTSDSSRIFEAVFRNEFSEDQQVAYSKPANFEKSIRSLDLVDYRNSSIEQSDFTVLKNEVVIENKETFSINNSNPSGLNFRVQVGAFRRPVREDVYREFTPVSGQKLSNGLIVYMAGYFNNSSAAINARKEIRKFGYSDAFIVAYCNDERLSFWKGREYERNGTCISNRENDFIVASISEGNPNKNNGTSAAANTQVEKEGRPLQGTIENTLSRTNGTEIANDIKRSETQGSVIRNSSEIQAGREVGRIDVSGLFYAVQVGAFKRKIRGIELALIPELDFYESNGLFRYSSGKFKSIDDARIRRTEVVSNGVSDAFVVVFYNGKRITMKEARDLLQNNGDSVLYQKTSEVDSGNVSSEVVKNYPITSQPLNLPLVSSSPKKRLPIKLIDRQDAPSEDLVVFSLNSDSLDKSSIERLNRVGVFHYNEDSSKIRSQVFKTNDINSILSFYVNGMQVQHFNPIDFEVYSFKIGSSLQGEFGDWLLRNKRNFRFTEFEGEIYINFYLVSKEDKALLLLELSQLH